jgi:hypothetical protein
VTMQDISTLRPVVHEIARMFVDELRGILANESVSTSDSMLPSDVAKTMKVSPKRVYAWIETGQLRAINLNPANAKRPRWSIDRSDLETFRKSLQPTPRAPRTARRAPTSSAKRY